VSCIAILNALSPLHRAPLLIVGFLPAWIVTELIGPLRNLIQLIQATPPPINVYVDGFHTRRKAPR